MKPWSESGDNINFTIRLHTGNHEAPLEWKSPTKWINLIMVNNLTGTSKMDDQDCQVASLYIGFHLEGCSRDMKNDHIIAYSCKWASKGTRAMLSMMII